MIKSISNYIINNCIFKEDEDYCLALLTKLDSFIVNSFIEELSFKDAIELIKMSDSLFNILDYLFKNDSNGLREIYHNSEVLSTIIMGFVDIKGIDLDVFLYGNNKGRIKRILTFEEVKSLIIRIRNNDENAKLILYEHNIGLVKKIARSYSVKYNIDFEDLEQQGTIGLLVAMEKYDYTLGYKFSTYAIWKIRQEINRFCEDNCNLIRIPNKALYDINKIRNALLDIKKENGGKASLEDIASKTGFSVNKVKELINVNVETVSLEQRIFDEEKSKEIKDFIESKNNPEEESIDSVSRTQLLKVLKDILTPKEMKVLLLRNGFYGYIYTLEEIGKMYGVTRERIRQIESKALLKLNTPGVYKMLLNKGTSDHEKESLNKKGIMAYFPNNTLEEIQEQILKLPESQIFTIYRIFGKDLKSYYAPSEKDSEKFKRTILLNLHKLLKGGTVKGKHTSIFELFPATSADELINAINKLPSNQKALIYKKFGNNLDEYNILSSEETTTVNRIIKKSIRRLLNGEDILYKNATVLDWFNRNSKEEILDAINALPKIEKDIVFKCFGNNLDDYNEISSKERLCLNRNIKNHIQKILMGKDLDDKDTTASIYKWYPGYSKEEILLAIKELPTKQRNLVYRKFGTDLDEWNDLLIDSDISYLNGTVKSNIKKLLKGEKINISINTLSLREIYKEYSSQVLESTLDSLTEYERFLLQLKYGSQLDEVNTIPREIYPKVEQVRKHFEELLKSNSIKPIPSIYEKISIDPCNLNKRIKELDPAERESLYKRYGYDLVNSRDIGLSEEFINYVDCQVFPKLMIPSKSELYYINKLNEIIDQIHNDNLLLDFSNEEILITILKEGINSIGYSDYYICNLLAIDDNELNNIINSINSKNRLGFDIIRNVATTYIIQNGIKMKENVSEYINK